MIFSYKTKKTSVWNARKSPTMVPFLPYGHVGCFKCVKQLWASVVSGKEKNASCPICEQRFCFGTPMDSTENAKGLRESSNIVVVNDSVVLGCTVRQWLGNKSLRINANLIGRFYSILIPHVFIAFWLNMLDFKVAN